jgi:hypothetical protein
MATHAASPRVASVRATASAQGNVKKLKIYKMTKAPGVKLEQRKGKAANAKHSFPTRRDSWQSRVPKSHWRESESLLLVAVE